MEVPFVDLSVGLGSVLLNQYESDYADNLLPPVFGNVVVM